MTTDGATDAEDAEGRGSVCREVGSDEAAPMVGANCTGKKAEAARAARAKANAWALEEAEVEESYTQIRNRSSHAAWRGTVGREQKAAVQVAEKAARQATVVEAATAEAATAAKEPSGCSSAGGTEAAPPVEPGGSAFWRRAPTCAELAAVCYLPSV